MNHSRTILSLLLVLGALCVPSRSQAQASPIRVACVGNSITEGAGNGDSTYPKQLQALLGDHYDVRNYGLGGRTLLKEGDHPYWKEQKYQEVLDWDPQIVIIMLGTNDSKPQNWKYASSFVPEYEAFVGSFLSLPGHPRVWICYPTPAFKDNYGISASVIQGQILPDVRTIARKEKVRIIDMFKPMAGHGNYFHDGIHPEKMGDALMAATAYKAVRHYHPK